MQYWHSGSPPDYILDLVETFRCENPEARHLMFDRASAEAFVAENFSAREVTAFRACGVPAMQADYLRYCAALVLGGVYCDVGYRCTAPLRTLLENCAEGRVFRRPAGQVVNGFFGFVAPRHRLFELVLELATVNIERRIGDHVWQVTGPAIFTALWMLRELNSVEELVARSRDVLKGNLEPVARTMASLAVSPSQALEATEGIEVDSIDDVRRWLEKPDAELPYKRGATHWLGYADSIFCEASSSTR